MWDESARRVVHDHARRAELGQLARLLDERVRLICTARAVDEPCMERAACVRDRGSGLAEVGDVVQRIVEAEHLDSVLGGARYEPHDDVATHGARADEEATAQRDPERRRHARLDPADSLPRALDAAAHGGVEDASTGHLQARKTCLVEDLGNA